MDGVLLADKRMGVSSHDVVVAARRLLSGPRTGHAGTLDPFATGLLLILVGRATRLQRYLLELPKTYRVVCRLGATSSTGDPHGEIVHTGRLPPLDLPLPTGPLQQRPPAYSAVHVSGERAYRRARRGETFELPARPITVHRFVQLWRREDRAAFEIECSSGTYVRSLIADLGDAYCEQLRRTAIGPFDVCAAVDLHGESAPGPLLGLDRVLSFLPTVSLGGEWARRAAHGGSVPAPARTLPDAGPVLLKDEDGPVAVARARAGASGVMLKPEVGLRG